MGCFPRSLVVSGKIASFTFRKRTMRRLFALAALLFSAALVIAAPGDVHLALGNPSNAKADPKDPDHKNYLIVKDQFALSYNDKKGIPNWVSYKFRRNDCGRAPRGDFHPDPSLP